MGLMKRFFSQTRKPEGFLGKVMLSTMNSGHAKMADWGMSHLPKFEGIIEGMKCYTTEDLEAALKAAGFCEIASDHHPSKPWLAVLASK